MSKPFTSPERRSFLRRLNTGAASLAGIAVGGVALAQVKQPQPARWEAARHDKDDWLDQLPGKHRLIFDTTTAHGLGNALLFANNYIRVNRTDYGLENGDLAVISVVRHMSAAFAFSDAMWAKYGTPMATQASFEDPTTKQAPVINVFNAAKYGTQLSNFGATLESLAQQGMQLAVCSVATRAVAGIIARAVGGNVDAINRELIANLVSNARMVPAGIVAVNRAQERGYSLVTS